MKKIIIPIIAILALSLVAWFLLVNKTTPAPINKIDSNSPFGTGEGVNIPALNEGPLSTNSTTSLDTVDALSEIFRISNAPVAGFVVLGRNDDVTVRFVERASGNLFDASLLTGLKKRLTNNTIPKVYEAYFKQDGLEVLLRTLESDNDIVKNLSLTLTPPQASSTDGLYKIVATNLRGDLDGISVSGNTLNYVLKDSSTISSSNFSGNEQRTLLSTPFVNWRTSKLGSGLLIYPKAHSQASGSLYSLSGGSITKLAGPFNGATAVGNSNGSQIIYSFYDSGITRLFVKKSSQAVSTEIEPATLAEKCAWSPKNMNIVYCGTPLNGVRGSEPDNWYLGRTSFTDYVWRFNTDNEVSELVSEPKTKLGLDIDVYQPAISPNEDFMVFINKRDLTLWAIRLN